MSQAPRVESRGGDRPDWEKVVMGEPLPEQEVEYPEPESTAPPEVIAYAGLASAHGSAHGHAEEPPGANDPEAQ